MSSFTQRGAASSKIHVRETTGRYTKLRWACLWVTQLVFFGLPWLNHNGRQMLLFDLAARKFYVFGVVLWPQDFIYLAALLIICACALFLCSAVAGRAWCGFACPHTVYTDIFMWIERKLEGGRGARIRRDQASWSARTWGIKALKHAAWGLAAFWTGLTLVGYFTPIRQLAHQLPALAPWEWGSIALYGGLTYLNAGWMREQVCRFMCPYARFQSAMVDRATLLVTYDAARGEPRGLRNRNSVAQGGGQGTRGDCIDCTLCIQVCPTGSDIRRGLQYDCMACASCIDACNLVMDKIGAARGLIRFAASDAVELLPGRAMLRPRVLIYAALLAALLAALALALGARVPLKLGVMRDRGAAGQDMFENVYRLHLINTDERAHRYTIAVSGIDGIALVGPGQLSLEGTSSRVLAVRVRVAQGKAKAGSNGISFALEDRDDPATRVTQAAVFLAPPA